MALRDLFFALAQKKGSRSITDRQGGDRMGEIIISILIGAFLVLSGIAMNIILTREEKKWSLEKRKGLYKNDGMKI